jgi:glyoxylate reductase
MEGDGLMSERPKIFATHRLPTSAVEVLSARCDVLEHGESTIVRPDELAAICREQGIEGILLIGGRVTADVVREGTQLRAVSSASVGFDHIDLAACTARRIAVTTAVGSLEETTADLAFALMLAVARRIVEADRYVRDNRWKQWQWDLLWGANVHHKTLGIIGFGSIGQAVARRGRGFAMRILYHARRRVAQEIEAELQAQHVELESLLRESDFVSLHVPLTPETHHLIRARELHWMKLTAFLINTARGRVVDEEALVDALKNGQIRGAGLDVYEREPRIHAELLKLENVVLAPHIGSGTDETRNEMAKVAAENLVASLNGQRSPSLINPEVLSAYD